MTWFGHLGRPGSPVSGPLISVGGSAPTADALNEMCRGLRSTTVGANMAPGLRRAQLNLFLSYESTAYQAAQQIANEIASTGWCRCFFAPRDIEPMAEWRPALFEELAQMDALVALISPSFARSAWTCLEVGFAFGAKKPIASLQIGGSVPSVLSNFQTIRGDFNPITGQREVKSALGRLYSWASSTPGVSETLAAALAEYVAGVPVLTSATKDIRLLAQAQYLDDRVIPPIARIEAREGAERVDPLMTSLREVLSRARQFHGV